MRVLGIIAEYNPFHNGHLHHLETAKEIVNPDFTVAIISGNFSQRGEISILDKWEKGKLAVENGIDLVIELPFVFACNNSKFFSYGATEIFKKLNFITDLAFGVEEENFDNLLHLAGFLKFFETSDVFKHLMKENIMKGFSYPKAQELATKYILDNNRKNSFDNIKTLNTLSSGSNNILAIEYLKNLISNESYEEFVSQPKFFINPVFINRKNSNFNSTELQGELSSATSIRNLILNNNILKDENSLNNLRKTLPESSFQFIFNKLKNENLAEIYNLQLENFFSQISNKILTSSSEELSKIYSITEGLENKLQKNIRTSSNLDELKNSLKSKRYTHTRISRVLTHTLTNLTKNNFNKILSSQKPFARVLAFNQKGSKLIKILKKEDSVSLPIITNINKEEDLIKKSKDIIRYDIISTDIFNSLASRNIYHNSDYVKYPTFIP